MTRLSRIAGVYEGMESSPNIFYTGAAPNQQIVPAVEWLLENPIMYFPEPQTKLSKLS